MADRSVIEWLVVTVLCAATAAAATAFGWVWRMDMVAYDAAMSLARPAPDPAVVLVAIDDPSLAEIGRWPWRRSVHAALIERLSAAGARVIAFDVILHEPNPDDPGADRVLADAIARSGRVILPVVQASRGNRIIGEAPPAPLFQAGAAATGHIHVELDPDGIARSVYLWEGFGRARHPQLALAALQQADPARAARYAAPDERASPGEWHRADWLRIPFSGPPGTYAHVSYADVLRGDVADAVLRDKIVFVGATALGLADSVPTPTSGFNRPMPGVEVNANVYSALWRGEGIRPLGAAAASAAAALIVIGLMVIMLRTAPRVALVWAFAGAGGTLALMGLGLNLVHLWFPPAGTMLGCMLCYPLWSWRRLEAAQRHLDAQLEILHRDAERLFPVVRRRPVEAHDLDPLQQRIRRVALAVQRQRDMRRFMADTLDGLPVGAIVTGAEGEVMLCNRGALHLLDVPAVSAVPKALGALAWPPGTRLADGLPVPDPAAGITTVEVDGPQERRLLIQAAGLADDEGVPIGRVFGLSDITQVRDAHKRREETMHYLSHDLRSPIASLLTLIEAERTAGEPDAAQMQFLRQLGRYGNAALKLADDLFRLVRADAIDQANFAELHLASVVQDALDEVWVQARARDVSLRFVPEEAVADAALVRGDRELVRRALANLLGNAIKYGPDGGEVEVALTRAGDTWRVSVHDQGEGIGPDQLPQLFRRFGRLKTAASRRESGVGLGLMIVKTVAERHGGRVTVDTSPGGGATFSLILPAAAADAVA
ncbi:CHASE2 domain-containing protein [Nitrogeniibacter mangrovi]|uniref:histidine kinase n=1 Tax=Nitrogeniibacter mangrovi TaxID=2016596 RepID=A0A6C1B0R2_9RHOO|nr:CHASE2 domain-containing protein [Nitrogeniibacter mangrovi]QID16418.1 CHASE2 domain-containing protein [Nitrogeniibacter mangrovi]